LRGAGERTHRSTGAVRQNDSVHRRDLLRLRTGQIVVSQSRRDADLTETDAIILVLDTFNDNQNAFVFGTNPLGIEYDGQVSGEGQASAVSSSLSGTSGSQRGTIDR